MLTTSQQQQQSYHHVSTLQQIDQLYQYIDRIRLDCVISTTTDTDPDHHPIPSSSSSSSSPLPSSHDPVCLNKKKMSKNIDKMNKSNKQLHPKVVVPLSSTSPANKRTPHNNTNTNSTTTSTIMMRPPPLYLPSLEKMRSYYHHHNDKTQIHNDLLPTTKLIRPKPLCIHRPYINTSLGESLGHTNRHRIALHKAIESNLDDIYRELDQLY